MKTNDRQAQRRLAAELGEPVAGNGLLHRRVFLRGGMAFTGFAVAAVTANDAAAQAAAPAAAARAKTPQSLRTIATQSMPGAPFTSYAIPSRYETTVTLDFPPNAAAPGTGSSRTP